MRNLSAKDIYSRRGTAIIKGLAILCMLYHHFFGLYLIDPSIAGAAMNNEIFASFSTYEIWGKVCLALFAFVTGFGYCVIAQKDTHGIAAASFERLRRFYPFFASFVLLFIILAYTVPYRQAGYPIIPERIPGYLLNLTGCVCTIADYWYIAFFLIGAIIYYPALLVAKRMGRLYYISIFIILVFVSTPNFTLKCVYHVSDWIGYNPQEVTLNSLDTPPVRAMALMRYMLVGWALAALSREPKTIAGPLLLSALGLLAFCLTNSNDNIEIIFIVFMGLAYILQYISEILTRPLALLGKYSACMWLNHRLIFGYWFADWFYSLPTPLNFVLLVGLSYIASVIITKAWGAGISRLRKAG